MKTHFPNLVAASGTALSDSAVRFSWWQCLPNLFARYHLLRFCVDSLCDIWHMYSPDECPNSGSESKGSTSSLVDLGRFCRNIYTVAVD